MYLPKILEEIDQLNQLALVIVIVCTYSARVQVFHRIYVIFIETRVRTRNKLVYEKNTK